MALASKMRLQLAINPDNTYDTKYPDGDKPPSETALIWGNLSVLSGILDDQFVGTPFSHNVRQYLAGTAAATATISVVYESGADAATNGFVNPGAGNNLTNAGANEGDGFFRLRATIGGNSVDSAPLGWAFRAVPVVADTLAPTNVTGFTVTPYEGGVTFAHDSASDFNDDDATPASLMAFYRYYRNGSLVASQAASAGLSGAFTDWQVGSYTPTPGATQSGKQFTLHSAGTGADGTADQLFMRGRAIAGDFVATLKVASMSGPVHEYAPAGIMCRESSAPGARYMSVYQFATAISRGVQGKKRITTDGTRTNLASATGTNTARWLRLKRVGNTWSLDYSLDGGAWTNLAADTLDLNSSVIVGFFGAALEAGTDELTAVIEEFNVSTTTAVTYDFDTLTGGSFTVKAEDQEGNQSASLVSVSATPLVDEPDVDLIKWNPGIYVGTYTLNSLTTDRITEITSLKASSGGDVQGVALWFSWRFIEKSKNDYSGTSTIISALNALDAAGLRGYLFVADDTFGGTTRYAPDYLTSEPGSEGGIYNKVDGGTTPKIWNAVVGARLNALWTRLGQDLNDHPALEAVHYRELTPGFGGGEYAAAGFTPSDYFTQLRAWVVATKAAFPNTNILAPGNYSGTPSEMGPWVEFCYQNGVGIGGPDLYPQAPYRTSTSTQARTWTDEILIGNRWNGTAWVSGGFDYRGKMLIANQIQAPEMGRSSKYNYKPSEFLNYARAADGMPQTHIMLWPKDFIWTNTTQASQTFWTSQLQPDTSKQFRTYLALGGHALPSTPPTFYDGNVD